MERVTWQLVAGGAALVAGWAARQATAAIWDQISDVDHVDASRDDAVEWRQALGWAVFAGVSAGVARVLAKRGASAAWESVTGSTPPQET